MSDGGVLMSILTRVRTILASNINAKVENAKDPEEEMNQYIREMERDLKGETEAAIVLMNRAKRSLNDCLSEIDKMERYATMRQKFEIIRMRN